VAGVVFGLVPDRTVFYISALCGLLGAVTTFLLVPDISGLDLSEGAATGDKNGTSSALQNLPVQQQLLVVLGAVQSGWQQACACTDRGTPVPKRWYPMRRLPALDVVTGGAGVGLSCSSRAHRDHTQPSDSKSKFHMLVASSVDVVPQEPDRRWMPVIGGQGQHCPRSSKPQFTQSVRL